MVEACCTVPCGANLSSHKAEMCSLWCHTEAGLRVEQTKEERTCLFCYIGEQRVARILTSKSHAFAVCTENSV